MKILSWNCNCKFREKFKEIIKYNADVYVIFANKEIVKKYQILFEEKWLKYSDHIPIMLEVKD